MVEAASSTYQRVAKAARARLHRHAGEPERGAIVSRGGLAGAQREQFHGLFPKLAGADEVFESIQSDRAIIGEDKRLVDIAVEFSVRGDVHHRIRLIAKDLLHIPEAKIPIHERLSAVQASADSRFLL